MTDDALVVATYAETGSEADTLVALLTANGIPAYAAHRNLEDVFPALFSHEGTAVMVRETDLTDARALLAPRPDGT